jgi:hypothetical protein
MPADDRKREHLAALVGREALRTGRGKALRLSLGFSLREAARVIDVDAATLLRWEDAGVVPRFAQAVRYGEVIGTWLEATEAIPA